MFLGNLGSGTLCVQWSQSLTFSVNELNTYVYRYTQLYDVKEVLGRNV